MDHSTKLRNYAALAIASASVMQVGCKKDTESDDPNITYKLLNQTLTIPNTTSWVETLIDINEDGLIDFSFYGLRGPYGAPPVNYKVSYIIGNTDCDVLTKTESFDGDDWIALKELSSGSDISPASTIWDYYAYTSLVAGTERLPSGIEGKGDKFIGIRFKAVGGNIHYGWLRVNVSADGATVKIIDHAYHTVPNTGLKAGSK